MDEILCSDVDITTLIEGRGEGMRHVGKIFINKETGFVNDVIRNETETKLAIS